MRPEIKATLAACLAAFVVMAGLAVAQGPSRERLSAAVTPTPAKPALTSFGGTGASITGNGLAFVINVGTVAPGNTGTLTFPDAAANGYVCVCTNVTHYPGTGTTVQSGVGTTTTCPLANIEVASGGALNWVASDKLTCLARAY